MTNSESPIFKSPGDDPEMEQAAAKVRQTFRYFWREMAWERRRIIPGLDLAAVKASFSDPPEIRAQNPGAVEAGEHNLAAAVFMFLDQREGWVEFGLRIDVRIFQLSHFNLQTT